MPIDPKTIPFELGVHEVAPNTYAYLQPDGGWGLSNAGLIVGKGESFLIDTLFDVDRTQVMLDKLAPLIEKAPIVGCLNTHENGDHCWGNQLLSKDTKIYAHDHCCDALTCVLLDWIKELPNLPTSAFKSPYCEKWLKETFSGPFDHSKTQLRKPDMSLEKSTTMEIGGRKMELLYLGPAHTEGDMVVYVPDSKVLYAGDLLFFRGFLIVWDGSYSNWIAICDKFLSMDVEAFVPGHGPIGTKEDVRDVKDMLSFIVETADMAYAAGERDPVALAYRTKIPEKWKTYGEQERLVMNFCSYWKEIDSNYKMPQFFELVNTAALYHEFLSKGGPQ